MVIIMKIDFSNKEIIESRDVNIHDFVIADLKYAPMKNELFCLFRNDYLRQYCDIKYYNVLFVDIQSCDFWGVSPHVLDWELGEEYGNPLTKKVSELQKSHHYTTSRFKDYDKLVESILTFSSGNRISVLCEYIEYEKT